MVCSGAQSALRREQVSIRIVPSSQNYQAMYIDSILSWSSTVLNLTLNVLNFAANASGKIANKGLPLLPRIPFPEKLP